MPVRLKDEEAVKRMLAKGLRPLVPYPSSYVPWLSECITCGDKVSPLLVNVGVPSKPNRRGCLRCAGQKPLLENEAIANAIDNGWEPVEAYPGGAAKKWNCQCMTCGGIYPKRANRITGCLTCMGMIVTEEEAVNRANLMGLIPLEPYTNQSGANWLCRCEKCGNEVSPTLENITRNLKHEKLNACKYCAERGMSLAEPGLLYLVAKEGVMKIGISQQVFNCIYNGRIYGHRRDGWKVIKEWRFDIGEEAHSIEQSVLSWWRDELKAPMALTENDMPKGGWTETASIEEVRIKDVIDYIENLI
jgi:hypothetical protein|tara:strand:+ start:1855 stop:2763 length:909 start_codon:yes stop_codon:yes gene_type:complete